MKRFFLLILAIVMCFCTVSCNETADTPNDTTANTAGAEEENANPNTPPSGFGDTDANKIFTDICSFDTTTYDLTTLVNGRDHVVMKNGKQLDGMTVKLDVGANVFDITYKVSSVERTCQVRIARRSGYRVVFNTNGGSFIETQYVGDCATIDDSTVIPTRDRYTFAGWYNDKGEKVTLASTMIVNDTTFTARWEGPNSFALPDQTTLSYATSSAALNIVWKDYDNAFGFRPAEVLCTLKNTATGATYPVKVTKTSASFVGAAPAGATASQGAGNWTVKITGLAKSDTYTFLQDDLNNKTYTAAQSGTTVVNAIDHYDPARDDTSALMTENGRFYDLAGNIITLKGVVTLNAGWNDFAENTGTGMLSRLQEEGANCVRVTIMVGETGNGYWNLENRDKLVNLMVGAINRATALGMYCIVDMGHIMQGDNVKPSAGYLNKYLEGTQKFFSEMAEQYKDNPYVLFEICNEPTINNTTTGWETYIKPFEEAVIRSIRETGSKAVVVAAPNIHARRLSDEGAAKGDDPIDKPFATDVSHNVAYTFHCYAYTTTYDVKYDDKDRAMYGWRVCDAIQNRLTVVMTEFSPATADMDAQSTGGLTADFVEADKWMNVILENDLNYMLFRGISGSGETSSQHMFQAGNSKAVNRGEWTYEMLSDSGKWFYDVALGSNGFIKAADFAS